MLLNRLDLLQFRNIKTATLDLSPGLNLIVGPNASGKTSLLEAIHTLATGRSFRSPRLDRLIQYGADQLQLIARTQDSSGHSHVLGLQRKAKKTQAKIDGEFVPKLTALVKLLPIHLIHPETHHLLEQGPRFRRQFLDWGVFHVEQSYLEVWQGYHRTLRQRNALLRQRATSQQIRAWNIPLADHAVILHKLRMRYVDLMRPHIQALANQLLDDEPQFNYESGWSNSPNLLELLEATLAADRERGFTQHGAHRADLVITTQQIPAQLHYSRGQQKLLISTFRLAHLQVLRQLEQNAGILLVDDLPAELDRLRRGKLLQLLASMGVQTLITATDGDAINSDLWAESKTFHVEHGNITEVV